MGRVETAMSRQVYLGVDLGAESGRVMAGLLEGGRLNLDELHRFANGPVNVAGSLRWNLVGRQRKPVRDRQQLAVGRSQ